MAKSIRGKSGKAGGKAGPDNRVPDRIGAPSAEVNRGDENKSGCDSRAPDSQNGLTAGRRDYTKSESWVVGRDRRPAASHSVFSGESHPGGEVDKSEAFGFTAVKKEYPMWLRVLINTVLPVLLIIIGVIVISWLDTTRRLQIVTNRIDHADDQRAEMKSQIRDIQHALDDFSAKQSVVKDILKNSKVELKKK